MSAHGPFFVFMPKFQTLQCGATWTVTPDVVANSRGANTNGTASISFDRSASAMLVSLANHLTETCLKGTWPFHQCGFASYSTPDVGSKLLTTHGPVPITRT